MNKIIILSLFAVMLFTGAVFAQDSMNYSSTDNNKTVTPSISPSPTMTQTQTGVGGGANDTSMPSSAPRTGAGGLAH